MTLFIYSHLASPARSPKPTIPALTRLINDPDRRVRYSVISAFQNLGKSAQYAIPNLILSLDRSSESSSDRLDLSIALANIGESVKSTPVLLSALNGSDWRDRIKAASALGKIGQSSKAIPILLPFLDHRNPEAREMAIFALASLGESGKSAIPALLPLLKDPNSDIRLTTAYALSLLGESAPAIPVVRQLLNQASKDSRRSATYFLGILASSEKSIIPYLRLLLKDADPVVRDRAAEALEKLGLTS
jgi:HEAT repeat protein